MKDILLALLSEIEDIRANLLVLSAAPATGLSLADAQEWKKNVSNDVHHSYADLRNRIEAIED